MHSARTYTVCDQTSPRHFSEDIRMLHGYTYQTKRLSLNLKEFMHAYI
jgi:hypothetical protein